MADEEGGHGIYLFLEQIVFSQFLTEFLWEDKETNEKRIKIMILILSGITEHDESRLLTVSDDRM